MVCAMQTSEGVYVSFSSQWSKSAIETQKSLIYCVSLERLAYLQ